VLGVFLLALQTFVPLLSYAGMGMWLPQGRYLFSGTALLVTGMSYGWVGWLPGRWRWVGLMVVAITLGVVMLMAIQANTSFFALSRN
jgi:hypothetical protein